MFFWKWTRKGKFSSRYVSLVLDFHETNLSGNQLNLTFCDCEDILCLMQDVEDFNTQISSSASINKGAFANALNQLGYRCPNEYTQKRHHRNLVLGQAITGKYNGEPLDYGKSNNEDDLVIQLDTNNLRIAFDLQFDNKNLALYKNDIQFIDNGKYYDLMPNYACMIEIVNRMKAYDDTRTDNFLKTILNWQ